MLKVIKKYLQKSFSFVAIVVMITLVLNIERKGPYFEQPSGHGNVLGNKHRAGDKTSVVKLAYGFFAVTENHLIAAFVNIERLKEKRLNETSELFDMKQNVRLEYVILTNVKITSEQNKDLLKDVKVLPYPKLPTHEYHYYESMVKLLFYNMTEYYRIIYIDVDALVLKSLDDLFNLPASISLASPVAYWENELCFTSALLVIKPNRIIWLELLSRMKKTVKNMKADMDLINEYYDRRLTASFKIYPNLLLLPGYFVILSIHLRDPEQSYFKKTEPIYKNIDKLVEKAYIVHFSGQEKPWDLTKKKILSQMSISRYFFDLNLEFIDDFKIIKDLLKSKKGNQT